jgi:tannase/feruloyl esterase
MNNSLRSVFLRLVPVVIFLVPVSAAAAPCESLRMLSLPNTTITRAELVAAGPFQTSVNPAPPRLMLPAHCRVAAVLTPSSDSHIEIEVWLPAENWNGKFQAVGDGGLAGSIPSALMAPALAAGYATAGTDTGHVGVNADFMPAHPEKLIDFAFRSTHEMAVAGKALIVAYYGSAPKFSYYNACSGGGRHGLTSAQRYPVDFDGIVAGAASWNQARLDASRIGMNLTVNRTAEARIPPSKYPMVHAAVLQACDAQDGVKDGLIENPAVCKFDFAQLVCKNDDGPSCLTAPQVESAKVLTSSFKDPSSGKLLLQPHLWPGTELQWRVLGGPEPQNNSLARVRNFHLKDPNWQFTLDHIAADVERASAMDGGLLASDNFNLKPFFDRGGKLLMWHGWSDPQVPPDNSIIYYSNVLKTVGKVAETSIALYMLPGVSHCDGGAGPDTFDKMHSIESWVEEGQKPKQIIASHLTNGQVDRTRPLCPYPQVAKYNGRGSIDDAANFSCKAP